MTGIERMTENLTGGAGPTGYKVTPTLAQVETLVDKQANCVITRRHTQTIEAVCFYPRAAAVSPLHNP